MRYKAKIPSKKSASVGVTMETRERLGAIADQKHMPIGALANQLLVDALEKLEGNMRVPGPTWQPDFSQNERTVLRAMMMEHLNKQTGL